MKIKTCGRKKVIEHLKLKFLVAFSVIFILSKEKKDRTVREYISFVEEKFANF